MKITALIFFLLFSLPCLAGSDFLLINNSPESLGRGGAGSAGLSDVSHAVLNPASTVMITKPQVSASYLIFQNNFNYNYFGAGYPVYPGFLSFHVIYLSLSDMDEEMGGEGTSASISYSDAAIAASYSLRIGDIVNAGVSLKYIRRKIEASQDSTWGLDLGVAKEFNFLNLAKKYYPNFILAAAVRHIGGQLKFMETEEDLPLTYTFGFSYSPYTDLFLSYDMNKTREEEMNHSLGLEYRTPFYIIPRIGLKMEEEIILMTGLGLRYNLGFISIKCDYAYNLLGQQVKSHAVSLCLEFMRF
ncbi:MAG: PorV/PorQ family protein [bacterium]|nr:PorV/PorQ family protein [bacterium]